ncbi:MAG: B12-binding domain-containing protein, partial [Anaerolineaceae bacterium]
GGHRVYSDDDIQIIKWLQARQAEGLSISRAVDIWKSQEAAGQSPLKTSLPELDSSKQPDPAPVSQPVIPAALPTQLESLRAEWINACMAFDGSRAYAAANQAFALYPVETVCDGIFRQGVSEIGRLWYEGAVSVQQEHFATALAAQRMEALIAAAPEPTRRQTVVIGCPPGEWHTFSALFLTLMLRRRGLKVIYLDANVPLAQMEQTCAAVQPDLVILAAQQLTAAAGLRDAALLFHRLRVPLAYGGLIFNRVPEIRQAIPAHFLGEDLLQSVETVEILLHTSATFEPVAPIAEDYQRTSVLFLENRPFIEGALANMLAEQTLRIEPLARINGYFAEGLSAALALGNLDYLSHDLEWVRDLIRAHQFTPVSLKAYLQAYRLAVQTVLGDSGALITRCMGERLDTPTRLA